MTVRKYRHVSEMDDQSWREPDDPGLIAAIRATWDLARRTTQPHFPRQRPGSREPGPAQEDGAGTRLPPR